jgi:hypothetical protein
VIWNVPVATEHVGCVTDSAVGAAGRAFTVIVIEAVVAHCPAVGVNVYVVVAVLFTAGDHVPVITLFDVVGRALKDAPEQIAET